MLSLRSRVRCRETLNPLRTHRRRRLRRLQSTLAIHWKHLRLAWRRKLRLRDRWCSTLVRVRSGRPGGHVSNTLACGRDQRRGGKPRGFALPGWLWQAAGQLRLLLSYSSSYFLEGLTERLTFGQRGCSHFRRVTREQALRIRILPCTGRQRCGRSDPAVLEGRFSGPDLRRDHSNGDGLMNGPVRPRGPAQLRGVPG